MLLQGQAASAASHAAIHKKSGAKPAFSVVHGAPLFVLSFLLWSIASRAQETNVAIAASSSDLYSALAADDISLVYLTGTIRLQSSDWIIPLTIKRNVTLSAHPRFQDIRTYITLDLASLVARLTLKPGVELRMLWLDLHNYVAELGQTLLLVGASPGGRVVFDTVVQRRRAGLSGERNLEDILALPFVPGGLKPTKQQAFLMPRFDYNASLNWAQQSLSSPVYMLAVSTALPTTTSSYFAPGIPLGEYDMVVRDTVHVSDLVATSECMPGASDWECVTQQLKLMDISPVIIRTKASDSNLVKIVASLAILTVSVLLFLYFRRHYKTYQQRRARRMRRLKEALGMGPEAHGVMFNGLDGEEPDWQIMPMPVGYAAEEGADAGPDHLQLHQDSNLRNLINDISNRPNRRIPDFETGRDGLMVEVDIDGHGHGMGPAQGQAMDCPIAAEVGLRITPVAVTAAAPAVLASGGAGEAGAEAGSGGQRRDHPAVLSVGSGSRERGGHAGGTGTGMGAAAGASGGSGLTVGTGALVSHQSVSVTSGTDQNTATGMHTPTAAAAGAAGTFLTMHGGGGGGGRASPRLAPPPLTLTAAGMDVLLASRAAAIGRVITPGDPCSTSGKSGSREGNSWAPPSAPMDHPVGTAAAPAGGGASHGMSSGKTTDVQFGSGGPAGGANSGGGATTAAAAAAANRHAVTFAAADVAERVLKSRDSDDQQREAPGEEGKKEPAAGPTNIQVSNLMDELEELRRDIMAGINDTQLQIMSVVGSGAFGTVYRGQWQGLEVAVKTVVFSASSENRKRALQEAALCQSINHRNIVATYAVDVQPLGAVNMPVLLSVNPRDSTLSNLLDWRLYIVQEYCDGGPLRKLVQSQYLQTSSGPNMPVICEVALELAQALAHLHSKNVIHGDLNPNNVLLKRDSSSPIGFRVKMADFGLSVMVPLQKTHMSNLRLGTLYYIAPETCFRGQLGYAADVFSLGVMLWELYHGRLAGTRTPTGEPRYQPDFPDFPAACPPDYRKLAHRCLQKQPHNRLHSSQVVQRLTEMIAGYRAGGAVAVALAALAPLPSGGPDDRPIPGQTALGGTATVLPQPPVFVGYTGAVRVGGVGTPAESRHRPASPAAAAAGPGPGHGALASPEISPWGGGA